MLGDAAKLHRGCGPQGQGLIDEDGSLLMLLEKFQKMESGRGWGSHRKRWRSLATQNTNETICSPDAQLPLTVLSGEEDMLLGT